MTVMRRTALVYRGKATCEGCPEALAEMLRTSSWGFDVHFVGKHEELPLAPEPLASADLYAQAGGGNSVRRAYRQMKRYGDAIRDYVWSGGRYLGICMGGYLAGHWRGFRLLPEDTDQYITSPGASVTTDDDTLVDLDWGGQRVRMFFQDGPLFPLPPTPTGVRVLARYASNGQVAALVAPFGNGWVAGAGHTPRLPWTGTRRTACRCPSRPRSSSATN